MNRSFRALVGHMLSWKKIESKSFQPLSISLYIHILTDNDPNLFQVSHSFAVLSIFFHQLDRFWCIQNTGSFGFVRQPVIHLRVKTPVSIITNIYTFIWRYIPILGTQISETFELNYVWHPNVHPIPEGPFPPWPQPLGPPPGPSPLALRDPP